MALEIRKESNVPAGLAADRRLWLTRDRESVVEDGSPDAAWLLAAGPGDVIPKLEATRLRLELVDGKVVQRAAESAVEPAAAPGERMASDESVASAQPESSQGEDDQGTGSGSDADAG